MKRLTQKKCVPCEGGTPPLSPDQVQMLTDELASGWHCVNEHHLEKAFHFKNFAEALDFTNQLGALAEAEGHHPEIHLSWGKVRVLLWTHAVGGLTENDFILAAKTEQLVENTSSP